MCANPVLGPFTAVSLESYLVLTKWQRTFLWGALGIFFFWNLKCKCIRTCQRSMLRLFQSPTRGFPSLAINKQLFYLVGKNNNNNALLVPISFLTFKFVFKCSCMSNFSFSKYNLISFGKEIAHLNKYCTGESKFSFFFLFQASELQTFTLKLIISPRSIC